MHGAIAALSLHNHPSDNGHDRNFDDNSLYINHILDFFNQYRYDFYFYYYDHPNVRPYDYVSSDSGQ